MMHIPDTRDPDFRQREVATLAYFLWQNAGEPEGTADRDWLLAEHAVETGTVASYSADNITAQLDPVAPKEA